MDDKAISTIESEDLLAWVRELEQAFAPYPAFVAEVELRLRELTESTARPARSRGSVSQAESQASSSAALPERRVLLLDDAELNRVLFSHYLRGLPVKLDFAVDLESALGLCGVNSYDLLLVDSELKGSVAADLVSALRRVSQAQIFALGAQEAQSSGFQGVLSRGLPKESLVSRLSEALWREI